MMAKLDHFDLISPLYDLIFGRRIDHEIVEIASVQDDQLLLDVGGGTGRVSILFKDRVKNVFIVDSSINMLREAQQKGINTLNANSEKIPFADETFQRVIIVDALHHVKNQKETLGEMWRVLAKGGKIIIEEPDINNFVVKLVALGEKIMLMRSHFISPIKIAAMSNFGDNAEIEIKTQKGIAWIVIQKKPFKG
jgi:demethylmenaquinone methyltransferase/2-methoxy-6-polyprenyl-1,4-benzoquinol methylase